MSNIADVVLADKNMATMQRAINATELEKDLSKPGSFTLFAPIEISFGKRAAGEFIDLLTNENKTRLTTILNDHIVEGKFNFKDFFDGQKLRTISGKELNVNVTGRRVIINGSVILGRDIDASNGVVHSLDALIVVN